MADHPGDDARWPDRDNLWFKTDPESHPRERTPGGHLSRPGRGNRMIGNRAGVSREREAPLRTANVARGIFADFSRVRRHKDAMDW